MTTIEFYYLMLCMSAFAVFAVMLSYNAMSWKSWKQAQADSTPAESKDGEAKAQVKLAA
jgi:hypothetical protein